MSETALCYLSLPPDEQKRIMSERIGAAPASIEAMTAVELCDRDQCALSVAGIIRVGFTPTYAPHLMETRYADLATELAPDCAHFQGNELTEEAG
jgi:hypothetical protein